MNTTLKIEPEREGTELAGAVVSAKAHIPIGFPSEQSYYWTLRWQSAEAEALDELSRGEFLIFDSEDPNDAARWLLSNDDDA